MYELMKIFDIDRQIIECFGDDGECSDLAKLQSLELAKEELIEGVALLAKQSEAMFEALKAEEASLKARKERAKRIQDRCKSVLEQVTAGERFETPKVCVSHSKSHRVMIVDEKALPPKFVKIETKTNISKKAIKEAIANGEEVPGAILTDCDNIQIK